MSQETAAYVALVIEPLTCEAFASSGDVIEPEGAKQPPTNQGTTIRLHDLISVDVGEDSRASVSLFRGQLRMLPFEVKILECYSRGSQALIPQGDKPYLAAVTPTGELDPSKLCVSAPCSR